MATWTSHSLHCPKCDRVIAASGVGSMTWWKLPLARLPGDEFPCPGCGHLIVLDQSLRRLRKAQLAQPTGLTQLMRLGAAILICELLMVAGAYLGRYPMSVFLAAWKTTILGPTIVGAVAWALIEQARLESAYEDIESETKV